MLREAMSPTVKRLCLAGRTGDSLSEDGNMLMAFQTLASSAQWEMAGGDQSHGPRDPSPTAASAQCWKTGLDGSQRHF